MSQRKDKIDKYSHHQEDFLGLLTLLESSNPETVESVKGIILEDLCCSKDTRLVNGLINFYVATHSKSSFEILLHLKDPHDKHLFEKINEMMKNESTRYNALQLLGNLVYRQPTWLYKIANHRLMQTLLDVLKTDFSCPNLLSGLFILICLLPMIPHLFGALLRETFDIFSRLAAWNIKKPNTLSDVLNLHLQTGVYSLFHRLYGMFPCNFLAYLRSFYGGRDNGGDNGKVFFLVIKPMLERVRLHPLLVTASIEAELNVNRWKKMAYHDIVVECASISLDTIEGTLENFKNFQSSVFSHPDRQSGSDPISDVSFPIATSVLMDSGSVVSDTGPLYDESMWSPIQIITTGASNLSSPTALRSEWEFKNIMQSSMEENIPLDFAVEAKPELLKSEISEKSPQKDFNDSIELDLYCLEKQVINQRSTDSSDITVTNLLQNSLLNDTKEDDADKEVSELTSAEALEACFASEDVRHDTPFCSTTQNLTDEPANLIQTAMMCLSQRSDSLPKNNDDEVDEVYNSMQEQDLQPYVSNLTRYRYFSHCGPPPYLKSITKIRVRSLSCPPVLNTELQINCITDSTNSVENENANVHEENSTDITTGAFKLLNSKTKDNVPIYEKLLPTVINPLQNFDQPIIVRLSSEAQQAPNPKNLSPPELLDHYIKQSSSSYLTNLPLTEKKDTDWTYFGGKPPSDEIDVLRNQILLLYNMILFERHRKDIHSERNRRILGRAKRSRMQEDSEDTLKRQINILKEENEYLKKELSNQCKQYQTLFSRCKLMKDDLDSKLFKCSQDNTQLLFSNKQIQTLLVSQKEENDEIRDLYKKVEKEIDFCKCELKHALLEVDDCQKFKKEAIFLTKQLIILQELNNLFKNKMEQIKEPPTDIKAKLMIDTMQRENEDLKSQLEEKTIILDVTKGRISELENTLSNLKIKDREKIKTYEAMRNYHQAEIMAREDRLNDIHKITLEKDAHILKLYGDIGLLKEEIRSKRTQVAQNDMNGTDNGLDGSGSIVQRDEAS